jgi:hypothetical protein
MAIRWNSTNTDLQPVDHEPVDLEGAFAVIDRYFSQLRQHYDSGEEALASTMFGFVRDDDAYIEICLHARDHIDVTYDFGYVERLNSRDTVRARTKLFFTEEPVSFRRLVES